MKSDVIKYCRIFFGPFSATHISKERNIEFGMDFVNLANILTDFL